MKWVLEINLIGKSYQTAGEVWKVLLLGDKSNGIKKADHKANLFICNEKFKGFSLSED
ncbi:hypothetical protein VCHA43P273_60010 [Vibrio chagasii]|nr:hypothetical protein VCHA43P273_60010 [Vibrio chagasii]